MGHINCKCNNRIELDNCEHDSFILNYLFYENFIATVGDIINSYLESKNKKGWVIDFFGSKIGLDEKDFENQGMVIVEIVDSKLEEKFKRITICDKCGRIWRFLENGKTISYLKEV